LEPLLSARGAGEEGRQQMAAKKAAKKSRKLSKTSISKVMPLKKIKE
jgi:hypothetical protein